MIYLKSFSIDAGRQHPFPYNIPAVKFASRIVLDQPVTIFVGDNGCGKSTLMECLALKMELPLISGIIQGQAGFEAARTLLPYIELDWRRREYRGFFFRAEDFSDFLNSVDNERSKIEAVLSELRGKVDDRTINEMRENMNYTLHRIRKDYGGDMQAYSHGEAYLKILEIRVGDKGIYMLDEPEAALSPLKQLSLMALILAILKKNTAQFILATHSPILMGIPDAVIYEIREEGIEKVGYKETDHYRITKTFLDNPEYYLRHLR